MDRQLNWIFNAFSNRICMIIISCFGNDQGKFVWHPSNVRESKAPFHGQETHQDAFEQRILFRRQRVTCRHIDNLALTRQPLFGAQFLFQNRVENPRWRRILEITFKSREQVST